MDYQENYPFVQNSVPVEQPKSPSPYLQTPQPYNASEKPSDGNYGSYYSSQAPVNRVSSKKKKANWVGVLAIAVACAILGSIAGGYIVGMMLKDSAKDLPSEQTFLQEQAVTEAEIPDSKPGAIIFQTSSNTSSGYMTPSQIYTNYVDAVVGITNEGTVTNIYGQITSAASSGTGFVATKDGYIITNYHVVEKANTLTVTLHNGEEYAAKLIGFDSDNDVALLKISANNLIVAPLGDSDTLLIGDQVAAIGNPLGELDFTMTVGYISAKDREVNTDGKPINMMQTDAAINSGNSGGPLFDMHGNVVGITTAKYSGSTMSGTSIEGLGFAIPINDVKRIINDLQEYGYVTGKPFLGITVGDIDSSYMFYYDYPSSAYVDSVSLGSCADRAGLKKGDIITAIGDDIIKSYTDLVAALKNYEAGDKTTITVFRNGEKEVLNIVFDERKPQEEPPAEETEEETTSKQGFGFGWPFP